MTRCREADRLMLAWYATARILRGDPGDLQRMMDDRGKPEYQRALEEYRQHIQNCIASCYEASIGCKKRRIE